jgi:hypothetical protein
MVVSLRLLSSVGPRHRTLAAGFHRRPQLGEVALGSEVDLGRLGDEVCAPR